MDLLTGDVELTEFEAIDVESIKGVGQGANGFPILMMKGLAPVAKGARDCPKCDKTYDADHAGSKCENCGTDLPDADAAKAADDDADEPEFDREAVKALVKAIVGRKVDETPDIAGGTAVIAQIADLIIAEAQELKAGNTGEISDIQQLACAAEMIWCWRTGEEAVASGSVMPATGLMQSAALKGLSDGTVSINDALAAFGLPPVDLSPEGVAKSGDDTTKSAIAQEGADVDTVTQGTGGLQKAVEEAVTKAVAPLQERLKSLDAELAKVKATPVPGGPVLSRNVQVKTPGVVQDTDKAAKAALMRQKAADATAPADREGYLAFARELDEEARKALPSA